MFGYNPYSQRFISPQIQPQMTMQPQIQPQIQPQMQQPLYNQIPSLQGKSVDSVDVVKAMDIPIDGSVSYFPLIDGSAIITKQVQQDGTSKIIIYKPTESEESSVKYVTADELNDKINSIKLPDIRELQEDVKSIKKQIRILLDKEE